MRFAAQLADADYGWAYVIVGWTLTAAVIAAYYARLVVRIRRAERTLPAEPAASGSTASPGSSVGPQGNLGNR